MHLYPFSGMTDKRAGSTRVLTTPQTTVNLLQKAQPLQLLTLTNEQRDQDSREPEVSGG